MRTSTRSSRPLWPEALRRPVVMGVVNATPDSFYAGSRGGLERAKRLLDEGADWLDVGGQSTRPGSQAVSIDEELRRVLPLVEALAGDAVVSIDTDKPEVARRAREAGARVLNDVNGLRAPGMIEEARGYDEVIVMHMQGTPADMQKEPRYADVVGEVEAFFKERMAAAGRKVLLDPGIGFGKTLEHNLSLLKHLDRFAKLAPVVLGVSRKSFLSKITPDSGPEDRLEGSLAAAVWGAAAGAKVLRVHDVAATRRALETVGAIMGAA